MASKLDLYQVGTAGVNLIKGPLQGDEKELVTAQNVEIIADDTTGGIGALSKRGGMITLVDFASSIKEMAEVRFIPDLDTSSTTVVFRPVSDEFTYGTTQWKTETGGTTNRYASIDELTPNDNDYLTSLDADPDLGYNYFATTTPVVFTGAATAGTFKIRARYVARGNSEYTFEVAVVDAGGSPSWASTTFEDGTSLVLSDSFVTYSFDLFDDMGYASSLMDWATISLKIGRTAGSVGNNAILEVSWMKLEMTHAN